MSYIGFIQAELAAAVERGVSQCVLIAARAHLQQAFRGSPDPNFRLFVVDEDVAPNSLATFVPTRFADETLGTALEKSDFDKLKATMFVWLGGAGYRALESVMASLAFVGSLPKGSGVLFDYLEERTSLVSMADTALDALASRISLSAENVKNLIQPRAVASMLHGLGFRQVVDLAKQELPVSDGHLVSAVV